MKIILSFYVLSPLINLLDVGSYNNSAFEEAMELGYEYRQSEKSN
jgi:hypothetical protein